MTLAMVEMIREGPDAAERMEVELFSRLGAGDMVGISPFLFPVSAEKSLMLTEALQCDDGESS
jgi:hypothetical protein